MNMKTIGIIGLLVVVVLAMVFALRPKPAVPPTVTTTLPVTVSPEEEAILSDQIDSLTEEELEEISTDLTDFSTTIEDEIADDSSLFMYQ